MPHKLNHLLFTFAFWLMGLTGFAQTFPVTISTQINQPSPIYWSNYADATTSNSPIKIQIVLNDLTISNRQVRIKCYWQGNGISFMNNDFVVGAQPLFLEGGVPLQLTNVNLAPYFEFQNIVGITPNQYAQAMPEGIYTFSVEVYDVATGQKLSRKSNVTAVIFQNEPPLLNLPLNKASIMQQNIQNIVFSWTPRQINVSNVEYQFDLVEIWDQYTPVQNAFAYSPPIYTTTTRATTLQYGVAEPQLIPGKRYAWRIKAKALVGAEEIGVFKNNGYSEIFAFSYDVYCTPPLQIATDGVSQDQVKVTWSGALDNYDYQVNYREKNADSQWYTAVTPREFVTLANLKPNTTYEYTVGAACEKGKYVHSGLQEFTTLAKDEIAFAGCGIKPDPKDLANQNPLPNLLPNDVVTAGDFPIVVIKSSGSNGRFTGEGYVTLPFLEKFRALIDASDALVGEKVNIGQFSRIRITFDNIGINTDFKLISGEIIASYDPNWKGMGDLDGVVKDVFGDAGEVINHDIQFEIATVVKNPDGTITVTGTNGASFVQEKTPNDIIFTDKNGKQYTVAANAPAGPIASSGQVAPGGIPTPKNTNGMGSGGVVAEITSPDVSVVFSKGNGKYAFDTAPTTQNGKLNKTYAYLPQKSGGTYNVPFKAISNSPYEKDVIIATVDFKNGKTKKDLVFKTQNGTAIDSTQIAWNGNVATLMLKRTLDFAKETVIATVRPAASKDPKEAAGKYDIAGTFDLWHLSNKKVNVTLVSVNGASIPSDAQTELNKIYEPAGVTFVVNTTNISLDNSWGESIQTSESGLLATYTNEQQQITTNLQQKLGAAYKKDTYYIIYTDAPSDKSNILGFMPLKRQYGFVFNKNNTIRTLAHELGHGVFGLEHPFTEYNTTTTTDLLMDYGTGLALNHNDWQVIHAPGLQLYPFIQGDSDGENVLTYTNIPTEFLNLDKKTVSFVTPEGQIVSILNEKLKGYEFIYGSIVNNQSNLKYDNETRTGGLRKFIKIDDDGKTFHEYIYENSKGYVDQKDKKVYQDNTDFSQIDGFIYPLLNKKSNYALFKLSYPVSEHQNLPKYNTGAANISLVSFLSKIAPYSIKTVNNLSVEIKVPNTSCLWCYDQNTKNMLKDYFGKPEQVWINKIAEMRVVYPKFFEKFVDTYTTQSSGSTFAPSPIITTYKWYENFRVGYDKPEGWRGSSSSKTIADLYQKPNKLEYFEKYFDYFNSFLNTKIDENKECLNAFFVSKAEITTINESQIECLKLATQLEFQKLESNKAIELVKVLVKRNLWNSEEEKILINILAYAKFNSDDLINLLENDKVVFSWSNTRSGGPTTIKKEYPLWYILFLKINDSSVFESGDNRKTLMSVFYQHFLQSKRLSEGINNIIEKYKLKTINEYKNYLESPENVVVYDYKNIFDRAFTDRYHLSVDAEYNESSKKISINQVLKDGLFSSYTLNNLNKTPFEFLLFKNLSKETLLSDYVAIGKQGKRVAIPIPAVVLLYASETGDKQTLSDVVFTSVDIATLLIPGGQLTKLGRVLFYADKISSVASMSGTAFRETNPELASFFNKASLVTGVVSVGDLLLPNNMSKMAKITEEFEKINDGVKFKDIVEETQLGYSTSTIKQQTLDFAQEVLTIEKDKRIALLSKPTKEVSIIQLEKNLTALKDAKAIDALELDIINKAIKTLNSDNVITETNNLLTLLGKEPKLTVLNKEVNALDEATKTKFLTDFAKANVTDLLKLHDEKLVIYWKKWGAKGIIKIDDLSTLARVEKLKRGTFDAFEVTVGNANMSQKVKAYELWGNKDWDGLYNYFHADSKNLINGGWPPFNGFIKVDNEVAPGVGDLFDRFQNPKVDKADGKITEVTELGGGFASPVKLDDYNKIDIPYTYDSRALLEDIQEGMVYIKFRMKNVDGLKFSYGDAIPWKNKNGVMQQGLAKQIQSNHKFHDVTYFIKGATYDIVQRSVFRGGKWVDEIEDLTFKVDKLIKNIDCK